MTEDVVKELGYLTLGTRLKRLGERLQSQTQVVLEATGTEVPASHFPILAALDRLRTLNVSDLTEALGVSQPGVTRMLDKLEADGLLRSAPSASDRRVRTIELTKAGRLLVSRSKRVVWPMIEGAVEDACAGGARTILSALGALEEALAAVPLNVRIERSRSGLG